MYIHSTECFLKDLVLRTPRPDRAVLYSTCSTGPSSCLLSPYPVQRPQYGTELNPRLVESFKPSRPAIRNRHWPSSIVILSISNSRLPTPDS